MYVLGVGQSVGSGRDAEEIVELRAQLAEQVELRAEQLRELAKLACYRAKIDPDSHVGRYLLAEFRPEGSDVSFYLPERVLEFLTDFAEEHAR